MVIDIEALQKNCAAFAKYHSKAIDVLKEANGKKNYIEISKKFSINPTKASSILAYAEKLGLATKKNKFYKKISGILGHMPHHQGRKRKSITLKEYSAKLKKKNFKTPNTKLPSQLTINFANQPEKMAKAYLHLYMVENGLRELIRKVLGVQSNWWQTCINLSIKNAVALSIKEYPYHAAKRKDELEYTHLGQLMEIIISKNNWPKFIAHLNEKNKQDFAVVIRRAIPSRNSIGHCTPLNSQDFKKVDVRFNDILEMIK